MKFNPEGLTYFLAGLALLSTMIGGGISQLPRQFLNTGLILGILMNIIIMILTFLSCYLYFQTKDLLHGLDSISLIGYKLLGRVSIFFMNGVIFILASGSIIIYLRLFGDVCRDVVVGLVDNPNPDGWY